MEEKDDNIKDFSLSLPVGLHPLNFLQGDPLSNYLLAKCWLLFQSFLLSIKSFLFIYFPSALKKKITVVKCPGPNSGLSYYFYGILCCTHKQTLRAIPLQTFNNNNLHLYIILYCKKQLHIHFTIWYTHTCTNRAINKAKTFSSILWVK